MHTAPDAKLPGVFCTGTGPMQFGVVVLALFFVMKKISLGINYQLVLIHMFQLILFQCINLLLQQTDYGDHAGHQHCRDSVSKLHQESRVSLSSSWVFGCLAVGAADLSENNMYTNW